MKKLMSLLMAVLMMGSLSFADEPKTDDKSEEEVIAEIAKGLVPELAKANNNFGLNTFKTVSTKNSATAKNTCYSPLSSAQAFQIALTGASGKNLREMAAVLLNENTQTMADFEVEMMVGLNLAVNKELLNQMIDTKMDAEGEEPEFEMGIANAVFLNQLYASSINQDFIDGVQYGFNGNASSKDFADASGTLDDIHEWVTEATREKIKSILSEDQITTDQLAILINATYFKAPWENQFSKWNTKDRSFKTASRSAETGKLAYTDKNVPTMETEGRYSYYYEKAEKGIKVPFKAGTNKSMYFLLPHAGADFESFSKTTFNSVNTLHAKLLKLDNAKNDQPAVLGTNEKIKFQLPKFKYEPEMMDLKKAGMAAGLELAFTPPSQGGGNRFDGIMEDPRLYLTFAQQKTYIDLNEEGVEAAAVTAIGVGIESIAQPPKTSFAVDGPFVYVIKDDKTGSILFMGEVYDPSQN